MGAPSSRVGQKSRVHANGQDSTEFFHGFMLLQLTDADRCLLGGWSKNLRGQVLKRKQEAAKASSDVFPPARPSHLNFPKLLCQPGPRVPKPKRGFSHSQSNHHSGSGTPDTLVGLGLW